MKKISTALEAKQIIWSKNDLSSNVLNPFMVHVCRSKIKGCRSEKTNGSKGQTMISEYQ